MLSSQHSSSTAIEYFDKSVPPQKQSADLLPVGERKDNKFRFSISLLPITYNEAILFWTAGESPMKLSAYYELSVVFLEPAPPVSLPGRVLAYGVNVFTEGAPQIIGSQNFIDSGLKYFSMVRLFAFVSMFLFPLFQMQNNCFD